MSGRNSSATDKALRDVARGMTMYAAAKKRGLAQSTVQRAVRRQAKSVRAAQDKAVFAVVDAHKTEPKP
jgi:hypothetical protein